MEPAEIKVLVYGAQNLEGKKPDRCKASVIFGVGGNRRRTSVVNSSNPEWNEDATFEIKEGDQSPLVFLVKDKEDILGEVSVTIATLPTRYLGRRRVDNLQVHRKCPNPSGQLMYDCWATKMRKKTSQNGESTHLENPNFVASRGPSTTFAKMKGSFMASPLSPLLAKKSHLLKMDRRASRSVNDVSQLCGNFDDSNLKYCQCPQTHSDLDLRPRAVSEPSPSPTPSTAMSKSRPEISGLSPREGPINGSTCVTIRGTNLGKSKNDIIRLLICGSNCLSSLDYLSPHKLRCITKPWKISCGPVVIETQSGGLTESSLMFEFFDPGQHVKGTLAPKEKSNGSLFDALLGRKSPTPVDANRNEIDSSEQALKMEIERLRKITTDLTEENTNMRRYIRQLVAKVMDKCPEILEKEVVVF